MNKKIAILGSTGSIGKSALAIARHLANEISVKALAAHSNIDLLESQVKEFSPKLIAVFDGDKAAILQKRLPHIKIVSGIEGVIEVAAHEEVDFVLSAMTGSIGIVPTVAAIRHGKTVGLANKEVVVSAGEYITRLAKEKGVAIIPVDSEHSAIFQCLQGHDSKEIRRLILTASGGPFFRMTDEELSKITLERALSHPTWKMGPKVTVDCSTLMNKGLELIEAHFLFQIPAHQIDVVIHPQSVIHSLVEFIDGSMLAQLSEPNMALPIQYALTYPERRPGTLPPFDFCKHSPLQFFAPDMQKFRCLNLAYEALLLGGSAPCFLNAANEALVARFLEGKIGWKAIGEKLEKLLEHHSVCKTPDLDTILSIDTEARKEAKIA